MGFSVWVDPDVCISSGNCVRRAPDAFAFGEEETAEAQPAAAAMAEDLLIQIARGCPVGAVRLRAEDGADVDPYSLSR